MASSSLELRLSLKPSYVPKTIASLLNDLSKIEDESDKLVVLNNYLLKYQEELSRVEAFKRELPQCMLLLLDAIETLKAEIMNIKEPKLPESRQPLMEFLSMKRKDYEDDVRIMSDDSDRKDKGVIITSADQLRNPTHDKKQKTILDSGTTLVRQARNLVPIQPCRRNQEVPFIAPRGSSSSLESAEQQSAMEAPVWSDIRFQGTNAMPLGGLNLKTDPKTLNYHPKPLTQPIWKNNRRSWSYELHARFVEALNILGGVEVATPKQIKEVMQVEGLTNDQVKSHLQKYRLHIRLPEAQADPNFMMLNADDPWAYYGL